MNSRKKRFWEVWKKRNLELALTDVDKANRLIEIKRNFYFGYSIKNHEHKDDNHRNTKR